MWNQKSCGDVFCLIRIINLSHRMMQYHPIKSAFALIKCEKKKSRPQIVRFFIVSCHLWEIFFYYCATPYFITANKMRWKKNV
jgi:hypothetical protein